MSEIIFLAVTMWKNRSNTYTISLECEQQNKEWEGGGTHAYFSNDNSGV